jgi:hypothetical protein
MSARLALLPVLALSLGTLRMTAASEARPEEPIVLPPFLVEDRQTTSVVSRLDWLYYEDGGFEVLSACPEDETRQFIRNLRDQRAALSQFIPEGFLPRSALPTTLILFPKSQKAEMDEQMVKEMERMPLDSKAVGHLIPMDDLRLSDPDSNYIFVVLDDWQWGWDIRHGYPKGRGAALFYSPPYLRYLIESRAPALPDWFTVGIVRLYELMTFRSMAAGTITFDRTVPVLAPGNPWQDSEFQMDPWMSPAAAAALRESPRAPRPLLPMRELFVPVLAKDRSEEYRRVWESQAELFVRWAFSKGPTAGRDRLRKLVEAASTHPLTEAVFESCFEMSYSDARDRLSDYLPAAVSKPLPFAYEAVPADSAPVELRDAKPEEIRGIKGEWARRTLRVVRTNYPEGLPLYEAKARGLLQGAYDRGGRDPRLLASLALFRLDVGDANGARRLLEENPAAATARPLAGLELAKLRMKDATDGPAGQRGKLSEQQARMILGGLGASFWGPAPMEAACNLAARVCLRLAGDPTEEMRLRLNQGARLYPRNAQMLMECVAWDLRAGDFSAARGLIELGAYETSDEPTRQKFGLLEDLARATSIPSS